jgi:hypothetical protein
MGLLLVCVVVITSLFIYTTIQEKSFGASSSVSERFGNNENYSSPSDSSDVQIPEMADWIDYGSVLETGQEGEWDFKWGDLPPVGMVVKDGIYYFYYVGSDGHTSLEGEPRHRAIGVATSPDGIHFTKYEGNPILTYSPLGGEEEGANSGGITLSEDGKFILYYGAAKGEKETIRADGRVAVSEDGFHFTDQGRVLNHINPFLYGFGDELFPEAAFQYKGKWFVYYEPNGAWGSRTLGVAWGNRYNWLPLSSKVLDESSGGKPVGTWSNVIWLAPDKIALFIQRLSWPDKFIEVRTASPDAPQRLGEPIVRYDIPNLNRGMVFLDRARKTWFLYYNDFDKFWDVKLAAFGAQDASPPTEPGHIQVQLVDYDEVTLSWEASADSNTGIIEYLVYRDGAKVGRTKATNYTDRPPAELTYYDYEVSAVNFHGFEGPRGKLAVSTPADTRAPSLIRAGTGGDPHQVEVVFSEPVDSKSAQEPDHYSITGGVQVTNATLEEDSRTVMLDTTEHSPGNVYTIEVKDVLDRASSPNSIDPGSSRTYAVEPIPGLAAYWNFESQTKTTISDLSGRALLAEMHGPTWRENSAGGGLHFDGIDDDVLVEDNSDFEKATEDSLTIAVRVKPEGIPTGRNGYGIVLKVGPHPAYFFGLSYLADKTYQAQVITSPGEEFVTVNSPAIDPGEWHEVVLVLDAEQKLIHLYIDGEPVPGSPAQYQGELIELDGTGKQAPDSIEYYIGSTRPDRGAGSYFARHFAGLIQSVKIYDRALGKGEIEQIFSFSNE